MASSTSGARASWRSILLTTTTAGSPSPSALASTKRVCGSGPSAASTSRRTPSTSRRPPSTFREPHGGLHLLALRIHAGDRPQWEQKLAALGVEIVHRTRWSLYVRD